MNRPRHGLAPVHQARLAAFAPRASSDRLALARRSERIRCASVVRLAASVAVSAIVLASGIARATDPPAATVITLTSWPISETPISMKLPLPPGARPEKDEKLPTIDLSMVAGLKILLRKGVVWGTAEEAELGQNRIIGVCARAPAASWSAGAEDLVFAKMNDMIREELQKRGPIDSFTEGTNDETAQIFFQRTKARTTPTTSKPGVLLEARHILGFLAANDDVLACTAVCTEKIEGASYCANMANLVSLDGPLGSPPRGSFGARLGVGLARHPLGAMGLVVGGLMMFAGVMVLALSLRGSSKKDAEPVETDDGG